MKILLFRFFHYIWFIDSENLFHSYFERKNDKVLTFHVIPFPNFERSASFLLAPTNEREEMQCLSFHKRTDLKKK